MRRVMTWLVGAAFATAAVGALLGQHDGAPAAATGPPPVAAQPALPAAGDYTQASWATALLGLLGDPASAENLRAVTAWERKEGGNWSNSARFNPLNTTQREPGSWAMNSVGVQAYPSWSVGFAATRTTLLNGYYGGILDALRNGDCATCVRDAVAASPWGTGWFPV